MENSPGLLAECRATSQPWKPPFRSRHTNGGSPGIQCLAAREHPSGLSWRRLGAILGEMLGGALPEGGEVPELTHLNSAVTPQLDAIYRRRAK